MEKVTIYLKLDGEVAVRFLELAKEEGRKKANLARQAIKYYLIARKRLKGE